VVVIEWQTTRIINGIRFDWRGVDKFRIRNGKIAEERVYSDTAPLRALRSGEPLEPITKF
jgi:ketosteroid isomerase-like protein